jgi:hypothetical protein
MSRKAVFLGLMLCSGLTTTLAAFAAGPFFAQPPTTAGQPFSAVSTTQSTTVFSDGNRIVRTNTIRYFRDSQGRTRVERVLPVPTGDAAPGISSVIIDDPVSGERYNLIPQLKRATVFKLPAGGIKGHQIPTESSLDVLPFGLMGLGMGIGAVASTESAANTTSLGQKVINGLNATGVRVVRTIPSGTIGNEKPITSTLEEWDSSDLGLPLQVTQTSSVGGTITLSLGQLVLAQPDPSLFVVPSDYTRREINLPGAAAAASGAVVSLDAVQSVTAVKKP